MSDLSVTPYFPFPRVVLTRQSVDSESTAWVEARPNERYRAICSECGAKLGRIHEWDKRVLQDLPMGSHYIWMGCQYRKAYCPECRRVRVENLEFFDPYRRQTRRLEKYVVDLCRAGLTVAQVADRFGMGWETVKQIEKRSLEAEYGQTDYTGLKILAVDEISVKKRHHYLTVVLDYETGRVVWTGPDRTQAALAGFFAGMTPEQRDQIQAVALDMHEPYLQAVKQAVPQAKIVFDLYHVVASFNRVIDQVRLTEFHKADRDSQTLFKGSKYLFLKNRKEIRNKKEREHLRQLLALNQVLFTMMLLKDMLKTIWSYRSPAWAKRHLQDWCALARTLSHPEVLRFARMLERYAYGIIDHCQYPIHTSRLEGVNNKIKVIKRVAYGFHDQRYFSLKIIQAFHPNNRAPT